MSNDVRATTYYRFDCKAPESMFRDDWDQLITDKDRTILNEQNGLPCDAGGRPGIWCLRCHWGHHEDIDDPEFEFGL